MTDDPIDLQSHRTIAAQRVEVMRRKQFEELRATVTEMKLQHDALEKRLLAAIADSEKNIAVAQDDRRDGVASSAIASTTKLLGDGFAANAIRLRGGQAPGFKPGPRRGFGRSVGQGPSGPARGRAWRSG